MKVDIDKFIKLVTATVVMMLTFCTILLIVNNKQSVPNIQDFNTNWYLNNEVAEIENNKILTKTEEHKSYTLSRTITSDMLGQSLYFKATNQYVNVYIDNKLVHEVDIPIDTGLVNTPASHYNYITIPIDSEGKTIEIKLREHYNDNDNKTISFLLGEKSDIEKKFLGELIPNIVINISLSTIGILLITCSIFFRNKIDTTKRMFSLGMFSLSFAAWSISETYLIHWLLDNPIAEYFLCYGSLFVIPIYLIFFIRQELVSNPFHKDKVKYMDGLGVLHTITIFTIYMLQLFEIMDFKYSRTIFHIVLLIELIVLLWIKFKTLRKTKSISDKILAIVPFGVLAISIIYDVALFYTEGKTSGWGCRTWIYVYVLITVKNTMTVVINNMIDGIESKGLKEIAFTDSLTGINNRNAFVSKLASSNVEKSSILSFDVNNLKYYNDNFGHDKGDELLTSMANTLKKVFDNNVYRMGGDEFIVLLDIIEKDEIENLIEKFEEEVKTFNSENKIILQSAYGYASYEDGKTYDDLIKEADKKMYICKKKQKGIA